MFLVLATDSRYLAITTGGVLRVTNLHQVHYSLSDTSYLDSGCPIWFYFTPAQLTPFSYP